MYGNNKRNVTYIDDLPDLTEIENQPSNQNNPTNNNSSLGPDKYKKYIKDTRMNFMSESGMAAGSGGEEMQQLPPQQREMDLPRLPHPMVYDTPSCIEVSNHIQLCPICSKYYNNDRSLYILCIILLSIICILLLKRVLNL